MARRVDQLLPAAHAGDATGDAALHLAAALRDAGYDAGLYALTVDAEVGDRVLPFEEMQPPGDGDVSILHFALPSPLTEALLGYRGHRVIVYHNLTPPELLAEHAPEVARLTAAGRRELGRLARSGRVDLAIGVSRYNTADLERTGFAATATLPLPIDLARYTADPDPVLARRLEDAPPIVLTVGRIAPNKRLEDFLRVAAYYLDYVDADTWFVAVGGSKGMEGYRHALNLLAEELGLDDRVRFTGRVPHADLVAWYRAADVYLCTSVHEGFCAPLLEAMAFELPILARAAAAVPETLGNAGLTFTDPDPPTVAEALHVLATDAALRAALQRRARERLDLFLPDAVTGRWVAAVRKLAGDP